MILGWSPSLSSIFFSTIVLHTSLSAIDVDDHSIFDLVEGGGRTNIVFDRNRPHKIMRTKFPRQKEGNEKG